MHTEKAVLILLLPVQTRTQFKLYEKKYLRKKLDTSILNISVHVYRGHLYTLTEMK